MVKGAKKSFASLFNSYIVLLLFVKPNPMVVLKDTQRKQLSTCTLCVFFQLSVVREAKHLAANSMVQSHPSSLPFFPCLFGQLLLLLLQLKFLYNRLAQIIHPDSHLSSIALLWQILSLMKVVKVYQKFLNEK